MADMSNEEFRALAEKARDAHTAACSSTNIDKDATGIWLLEDAAYRTSDAFTKAASPEAIIGLLDRIKKLEAALKPFIEEHDRIVKNCGTDDPARWAKADGWEDEWGRLVQARAAMTAIESNSETEKPR